MARRKARYEAHVRLYRHEHESEAYQSLSPDARSLLFEFRALYDGKDNRIFMSVREIQRRIGIGQRRAQKARDQLIDRGFVRELQAGSFNRKARHAAVYALTSEPLDNKDGAVAPKDFMKWQKNTVAETTTDGSRNDYRGHAQKTQKCLHGSRNGYRQAPKSHSLGSRINYTDKLPRVRGLLRQLCEPVERFNSS